MLLLVVLSLKAQQIEYNYKIEKNGEPIGWLNLIKTCNGNQYTISLQSEIKTRILIYFSVSLKEWALFENGKMMQSSQYQIVNGKVKVNNNIKLTGENYVLVKRNEEKNLPVKEVRNNILNLYFHEPIDTKKAYAENHEQFVDIIRNADGGYLVRFPNGSSNCYYYENGICKKILVKTSFYTANIIRIL